MLVILAYDPVYCDYFITSLQVIECLAGLINLLNDFF